jgi:hypothetical protein
MEPLQACFPPSSAFPALPAVSSVSQSSLISLFLKIAHIYLFHSLWTVHSFD